MTIYIGRNRTFLATTDPRYETEFHYIEKIEVPDDYEIPFNSLPRIENGELFWDELPKPQIPEPIDPDDISGLNSIKNEINAV